MKFRLRPDAEIDVLNAAELAAQIDRLVKALEAPAKPRWIRPSNTGPRVDVADDDNVYRLNIDVLRVNQGQEFRLQRVVVTPTPDVSASDPVASNAPYSTYAMAFQVLRDGMTVDLPEQVWAIEGANYMNTYPGKSVSPDGAGPVFRNGELLTVQVFSWGGYEIPPTQAVVEGTLHLGAA